MKFLYNVPLLRWCQKIRSFTFFAIQENQCTFQCQYQLKFITNNQLVSVHDIRLRISLAIVREPVTSIILLWQVQGDFSDLHHLNALHWCISAGLTSIVCCRWFVIYRSPDSNCQSHICAGVWVHEARKTRSISRWVLLWQRKCHNFVE